VFLLAAGAADDAHVKFQQSFVVGALAEGDDDLPLVDDRRDPFARLGEVAIAVAVHVEIVGIVSRRNSRC